MVLTSEDLSPARIALKDGRLVALRPARLEDAADLIEIQRQVVDENVANVDDHIDTLQECQQGIRATDEASLWLVAQADGHVVGSIRLRRPGPNFLNHIRNLFIDVHRDWRRFGIGAALIAAAVRWATTHGVEMIALSVLDSNPMARSLYERLNFIATGHTAAMVKRPDGTYVDDTQMILTLHTHPLHGTRDQ